MHVPGWLRSVGSGLAWTVKAKPRKHRLDPRAGFASGAPIVGPSLSGWTDNRGDQARAFRHWVYVAIDLIASRVASQFPNIGHVSNALGGLGDKVTTGYHPREKALTPLFGQEDLERADHEHPLVRLFADPNGPDTTYDILYETVLFQLLTGVAYWWVAKNPATGLPVAIWVLPSHWVFPVFDRDGIVEAYDLRPAEGNYLRRQFPADEVVFFRKKSAISKVDGYSPQTAAAQWIDTALAIDRHRWYTHKNQAFPSAALEFSGDYSDPSDDDLARIEAKFLARYAGETRVGKPLLLPPGIKFHRLDLRPKDMDFTAGAEQIRDNILSAYHVPAALAGILKDVNGQALLAADQLFCSNAVNPLYRQFGQTATEHFRKAYDDKTLRVWWDDRTPEDPKVIEERLKTDMNMLAVTPNEVRIMRGRKPYPAGGDDPFMPHVGLILPWGSGQDINAVNPFTHDLLGGPKTENSETKEPDAGKEKQ